MSPSVDVVIPCYRYGHLLADCVTSVLSQSGVDVRVLIIDDASPDDSANKARMLAATDPRVEVWVHEQNKGHIATYNEGLLGWCIADYSVLLSADDLLTEGALRRATDLLEAHPSVGFTYGHYVRFSDPNDLPVARTTVAGWTIWTGATWLDRRFRTAQGCIASPEVVVRTSVQQAVGGYDNALPHTGDIEMWMRFAAIADVGYIKGADQAYYRSHESNMSKSYLGAAGLGDLEQRWAAYQALFAKCGGAIANRAKHESQVRRTLARDALRRAARSYDRRRTLSTPVDELQEFARHVYSAADRLPESAGLRLRRRIGPRLMPYLQPLIWTAVTDKIRSKLSWRRWDQTGV